MTPPDLPTLRRLHEAATKGPWKIHQPRKAIFIRGAEGVYVLEQSAYGVRAYSDGDLIVEMRNQW